MTARRSPASPGARSASPLAAWCNGARPRPAHAWGPPGPPSATPLKWACSAPPCCASATLQPRRHPASAWRKTRTQANFPLLAQQLARAVSSRGTRQGAGETETFFHREGRGAEEPAAALDTPGQDPHSGAQYGLQALRPCTPQGRSVTRPGTRRGAWTAARAPVFCAACRPWPACAAPPPRLALAGHRQRVAPAL